MKKLETSFYINAPFSKLVNRYPSHYEALVTTVYDKEGHRAIFKGAEAQWTHDFLSNLKTKGFNTPLWRVNRQQVTSKHSLSINNVKVPILLHGDIVEAWITTYDGDVDKHYEEVEAVVNQLKADGFEVRDTQCALHQVIPC